MSIYALLLGTLFTVGSALIAQIAVESASPTPAAPLVRNTADCPALGQVWYGGVLDPITVEARGVLPSNGRIAGLDRRDAVSEGQSSTSGHRGIGRGSQAPRIQTED